MSRTYLPPSYKTLVAEITDVYENAQASSARAVSAILVSAYWEIGRRIVEEQQRGRERAGYGEALIKRLSKDLTKSCGQGFSVSNLKYIRRFYLAYRKGQVPGQLRWGHYQLLCTVTDDTERARYQTLAEKKSWSVEKLKAALNEKNVVREFVPDGRDRDGKKAGNLRAARGTLYTYRVLECGKEGVTLDLGFNVWRTVPVKGKALVSAGELVESVKSAAGDYSLKPSSVASGRQYTFAARVERVVDGDTLWVVADLGFKVRTRVKLRLHSINTPELDTQKGEDAKRFVEERLADCDFIIIRTFGTDKYARYLADVYYLAGEESREKVAGDGVFLNQELLDARLAGKV